MTREEVHNALLAIRGQEQILARKIETAIQQVLADEGLIPQDIYLRYHPIISVGHTGYYNAAIEAEVRL